MRDYLLRRRDTTSPATSVSRTAPDPGEPPVTAQSQPRGAGRLLSPASGNAFAPPSPVRLPSTWATVEPPWPALPFVPAVPFAPAPPFTPPVAPMPPLPV